MAYILPKKVLRDVSQSLQDRGEKIVFTHGAFDLFHVGHFELLRRSKKKGDILVVGVDIDERIAKYKSNYRPIIPFKERIHILSALAVVDFLLPMDWPYRGSDEFIELYNTLNPTVITYGRKWGGTSHIESDKKSLKMTKFHLIDHPYSGVTVSTSQIIKRILSHGDALLE